MTYRAEMSVFARALRQRLIGFLTLLFLVVAAPAAHAQAVDLEGLDAYIEAAMADWEQPGLAVAIVKDDSVIYARGFGVTNVDDGHPVDEHTLFAIASTTKAFTAAALGILVDEGLIDWDDPVRTHMRDYRVADPYVSQQMTIRDMLSHQTGAASHNNVWI